jgi:hypothetical protein
LRIDFHTHIFPKEIRENRHQFFSGEKAFEILYQSEKSKLIGSTELISAMDRHEIDAAVVFGFPWKNPELFKRHNDYILNCTVKYPGRFFGFCCLDPGKDPDGSEAKRCLEAGMAGIGELAFYDQIMDDAAVESMAVLMQIASQKNAPVLIHVNEPVGHLYPGKTTTSFDQVYRLISHYPKNRIVLAHWGGGFFFFNLLKKEFKERFENIYVDTAASPFLYDPKIYSTAIDIIGPRKILFGSDYPLIPQNRYFEEMIRAGVSKANQDMLCGKNAARLLKASADLA